MRGRATAPRAPTTRRIIPMNARLPIATAALNDPRLSLDARGLLGSLLTLADPSGITMRWIGVTYRLGETRVARLVGELEGAGYLRRTRPRTAIGTFGRYEFWVTDEPAGVAARTAA
jgi:hypothetical protein